MDACIFCKIINKQIPSKIVFEDDSVLAFQDINPVAPVHVLIVPKVHIDSMNALCNDNIAQVSYVHIAAKKIAEELGIASTGYRLMANCGADGGQTVFHLHYHLLGGKNLGPILSV